MGPQAPAGSDGQTARANPDRRCHSRGTGQEGRSHHAVTGSGTLRLRPFACAGDPAAEGTGGWQVGGGASAAHTFCTFKTCPWSALWVVTTNSGSCSLSGNWTTETSGRAWRLPRAGWLTARPLSPVGELSATPVRTLTPSRGSTSRPVLTRHTGGGLGARASSRGCAHPHHVSGAVRHLAAR